MAKKLAPPARTRPAVKQGDLIQIGSDTETFIVARTSTKNNFFLISVRDGNRWDGRTFPIRGSAEIPESICSKPYRIVKREDVFKT